MATKSFLKNIVINDKNSARSFLSALEHAEGKRRKKIDYDKPVSTIKDKETIRKMFSKSN